MRLLKMEGGSYRHPPAHGRHVRSLCGAHLTYRHAHLPRPQVLVHAVLGHQSCARLLLVLQHLEPLLLLHLLCCRVVRGV